jgi:hypothetical protein
MRVGEALKCSGIFALRAFYMAFFKKQYHITYYLEGQNERKISKNDRACAGGSSFAKPHTYAACSRDTGHINAEHLLVSHTRRLRLCRWLAMRACLRRPMV